MDRLWIKIQPAPWVGILTAIALLASAGMYHFPGIYMVVGLPLQGILVIVLLVQLIAWKNKVRWLETQPFKLFGKWSYSLYLYHWLAMILVPSLFHRAKIAPAPGMEAIAIVATSIVLAAGSYYGIECPFLALKDRSPRVLREQEFRQPLIAEQI